MRLATDTHALVWYLAGQHNRLGRRALRAFREAEGGGSVVHVPAIVLMELSLLAERGRLRFSFPELREQLALRPGLPIEPLTADDVDEARGLPLADPFDRMIAGTALRLGVPLLTRDEEIRASRRVRVVW